MKLFRVEAGKCVYHILAKATIDKKEIIEVIQGVIKEMPEVARVLGHRDALEKVESSEYAVMQLKLYNQLKEANVS
jgi:hypothetical protein